MMQPADLRYFDHVAERGRLDRPSDGSILVKGQMCSAAFVVPEVVLQDTVQTSLVENDDVVLSLPKTLFRLKPLNLDG